MVRKLGNNSDSRDSRSVFTDLGGVDMDSPFEPVNLLQPDRKSAGRSATRLNVPSGLSRKPLNPFVAFIQVIVATLVLLALFLALGLGLVYLGQQQGLLPKPSTVSRIGAIALPTVPSLNPAATAVSEASGALPTADPCVNPGAWWMSIRDSFSTSVSAFSQAFYAPALPLDEVVAAAAAARTAAEAPPFPDCMRGPRQTLLNAMDAQNAALAALQAVDRAAAQVRATEAAALFASALDESWRVGADTGADSPSALGVEEGSCDGASPWYASLSPQLAPFYSGILPAVDVVNAPAITVSQAAADTRTILATIQALTPPACAQAAQDAAVRMLSGFADAIGATMGGRLAEAQQPAAQYAEASVSLDAWLRWLQLTIS